MSYQRAHQEDPYRQSSCDRDTQHPKSNYRLSAQFWEKYAAKEIVAYPAAKVAFSVCAGRIMLEPIGVVTAEKCLVILRRKLVM